MDRVAERYSWDAVTLQYEALLGPGLTMK
jgi:hypothetical protein